MAKRSLPTESALLTDHTSAHSEAAEGTASGKRRRCWTAEQKRQIVAESLEPGASAAMVAARHGISRGQFYAWRQQLLLRGGRGAAADTPPNSVGIDVTTAAQRQESAIPAPPMSGIPVAPVAPPLAAQPDTEIVLPRDLPPPAADGSGARSAPTTSARRP